MTTPSWFVLLIFVFGVFGDEYHIGQLPKSNNMRSHSSLKIINGKPVNIKKYPFMASLQITQSEFGAAVILNKDYLLTTAFNVAWPDKQDLQFRVGSKSYSSDGQVLTAAEVYLHPNYTGSYDYDIAVIKTNQSIKMGKKVKPITMATTSIKAESAAKVVGWGETSDNSAAPSEVLLEGDVTVLDWDVCNQTYNTDLTPRLVCTLDKQDGPCKYDYGDPLIAGKPLQLYGLFAGGYSCYPGNPVLYSDVAQFASWVYSIISSKENASID